MTRSNILCYLPVSMGFSSTIHMRLVLAFLPALLGTEALSFSLAQASSLALSPAASATRLGVLAEQSPWVRVALESAQGRALARALRTSEGNTGALIERLAQPGLEPLRMALEGRVSEIDARVRELDSHRRHVGSPELSAEERRFFIELLSRRTLALSRPADVTDLLEQSGGKFSVVRPEAGSVAEAKRFFIEQDVLPGRYAQPARLATELEAVRSAEGAESCESAQGAARSMRRRLGDWLDEMRACQLRQPPKAEAASASKWRYFLTGLAINEAIIAGTYVVGMGEEEVNIEELSTDMLVAAVYMAAGTSVLRPNTPFRVQWFRVTSMIAAQDVVDSTIYLVSPMHRLRNGGEGAHSMTEGAERLALNWSYTWTISGIAEAGLFEIVSGLECLYPNAKWMSWAPGALRLTQATVAGLIYYSYRHATLGH